MFLIECGTRLAAAGYAVFGIDYEGHGRSKGARCYIKKFENIVNDCSEFFKSICGMCLTTIILLLANSFSFSSPPKSATMVFQHRKNTGISADSYMESQWEVQ